MAKREESLYEVRGCLFGIPLWKLQRTRRELQRYALLVSNKKEIIELKLN